MYLAKTVSSAGIHYTLRRSVPGETAGVFRSEVLFEFGADPGRYIIYPGGNAFYVDPDVEEEIEARGAVVDYQDLEAVLLPFVDPYIREKIEPFVNRRHTQLPPMKMERIKKEAARLHPFDKRRQYYLRCGRLEKGDLRNITDRLYRPLFAKSRDELEHLFRCGEAELQASERKDYVYFIFELARHFPDWMFARSMPETVDPLRLDDYFVQDLCQLYQDDSFWAGSHRPDVLPWSLARYVIMFFDYEFANRSFEDDFVRNFREQRRQYRPPAPRQTVSVVELEELFGKSVEDLKQMSRRALTRLFRQRAKKMHPDIGGDHDIFVRLLAAYEELIRR